MAERFRADALQAFASKVFATTGLDSERADTMAGIFL